MVDTITTDLEPVPSRQDPSTFSSYMDTWLGKISTWTTEANALATGANTNAVTAAAGAVTASEAASAAAANANFVGNWDDQTGAAAIPYSVRHSLKTWQLITGLADVTTVEPGVTAGWATYWADISSIVEGGTVTELNETINTIGDTGGGSDAIDYELGGVATATVSTAEQTFTFTNPPSSGVNGSFVLFLTNGGSQTVNWPASVDWVAATAPTLTAAGVDVLVFTTNDAGTTWLGFVAGLDVK